jgi:hypothetical protein
MEQKTLWILRREENAPPLKHYFGNIHTASGTAKYFCCFCGKQLHRTNWLDTERCDIEDAPQKAENCPRGENKVIILDKSAGTEHILNSGYRIEILFNYIQDEEFMGF